MLRFLILQGAKLVGEDFRTLPLSHWPLLFMLDPSNTSKAVAPLHTSGVAGGPTCLFCC